MKMPLILLWAGLIPQMLVFGAVAREDSRLDADWRFKSGDATGAEQAGFDDSAWQPVTLPHNWGW